MTSECPVESAHYQESEPTQEAIALAVRQPFLPSTQEATAHQREPVAESREVDPLVLVVVEVPFLEVRPAFRVEAVVVLLHQSMQQSQGEVLLLALAVILQPFQVALGADLVVPVLALAYLDNYQHP